MKMCTDPAQNIAHAAEKVREAIPSMERLRFVNSGTEATMSAIRVARGYTGRNILVKFEGNYHGHADHLLVSAGSGVATITNASSAGVPDGFVKYTVVLPYNDVNALHSYFNEHGDEVAALILEPVACNMGVVVPTEEFLKATREVTNQHGAVLIFDEYDSPVLNVIDDDDAVRDAIRSAVELGNGVAYFTVHEGNGTGIGSETQNGLSWQRNQKLRSYEAYCAGYSVEFRNGVMTVRR